MNRIFTQTMGMGICAAAIMVLLLTALSPAAGAADAPLAGDMSGIHKRISAQGAHLELPIYQVGIELITEGTNNYTIERKMRNLFPLDLDLTVFIAWGYTGDKINVKITDTGDMGDRIFAIALGSSGSESIPAWGTLYSSAAQDSFEISLPVTQPGGLLYLLSGFFAPSAGEEAYAYTITVSFPQ